MLVFSVQNIIIRASHFGSLAQSVEQLAFNQLVAGSNPARPTIYVISKRALVSALFYCVEVLPRAVNFPVENIAL